MESAAEFALVERLLEPQIPVRNFAEQCLAGQRELAPSPATVPASVLSESPQPEFAEVELAVSPEA
jgi:hypothetical protein